MDMAAISEAEQKEKEVCGNLEEPDKIQISNTSSLSTEMLQDLTGEIDKLSISETTRTELKTSWQEILTADFRGITLSEAPGSYSDSDFDKNVTSLMKFSNISVKVLQAAGSLPTPLGIVCRVVAGTAGLVFSKDVSSAVAKRFEANLDVELRAKCRASCTKISHCISYMQGLPNPKELSNYQKDKYLLLMAADVPVQTGLDEVLFLGEKISSMVEAVDMSKLECLMNYVELYCCLATFRELFLLYRFAVQSLLEVDAKSVQNVLESQFMNDRSVLEFLYKPTTKTAKLFYNSRQRHWPLSRSFCERRNLTVENLSCLHKGVFKITSVQTGSPLRTYDGNTLFRAGNPIEGVYLELHSRKNNVFSIQMADSKYVGNTDSTSYLGLVDRREHWYFVKVDGNSSSEKQCYLIWLDSDITKCMYENVVFPATSLTTSNELGPRFFWTLGPF